MLFFPCPHLGTLVELSAERERHIAERHPELVPGLHGWIAQTLQRPASVRRSLRSLQARLFTRCYPVELDGKHVVVVVHGEPGQRHWILTACSTPEPQGGTP